MNDTERPKRLTSERVMEAIGRTTSVAAAAEELGVHRVSLYRFMREQGIRIEHERRVVAPSG